MPQRRRPTAMGMRRPRGRRWRVCGTPSPVATRSMRQFRPQQQHGPRHLSNQNRRRADRSIPPNGCRSLRACANMNFGQRRRAAADEAAVVVIEDDRAYGIAERDDLDWPLLNGPQDAGCRPGGSDRTQPLLGTRTDWRNCDDDLGTRISAPAQSVRPVSDAYKFVARLHTVDARSMPSASSTSANRRRLTAVSQILRRSALE